ncbi:MAG TPA: hypothetical protein VFA18_24525 [Gemmataceae bacterium]|nr:hypothetical protein [Gemmataceae bacterium]
MVLVLASALVLSAACPPAAAGESGAGASELRTGTWIKRSPRDILGRGIDEVISLKKVNGCWEITLQQIRYSAWNHQTAPQKTSEGPFQVQVHNHVLSYKGPHGTVSETFRFADGALILPAIVQTDRQTWLIRWTTLGRNAGGQPRLFQSQTVWHCQADPRKTPTGLADFSSGFIKDKTPPATYPFRYVLRQPKDKDGHVRSQLRFFQILGNRVDTQEGSALTWDHGGNIELDEHHCRAYGQQRRFELKKSATGQGR